MYAATGATTHAITHAITHATPGATTSSTVCGHHTGTRHLRNCRMGPVAVDQCTGG